MTNLTLARNFALPIDAVTTAIGVIGIRGSGKTHTASVVAEEMLAAGLQVIVLDPLDVWSGLRTSADGKGAGFPITVLGGEHADIPLEAASGAIVADFAVQNGASLVLSLRHFSKTDQRRFVADFCEKLYRLKGQSSHRDPVHIIIDEADEVAPQKLSGKEGNALRCFGAVDTLVRRGRSSGIGVTLITQRPAAINKDVLTQIELLIAHRVISPQDRKAIELWIEAHPVGETAKQAAASLASLDKGECWVWSPSWLDVFKRVTIRQRRTFDSSATPKVGERKVTPSGRAVVDLDGLRAAMAETIQRAEADDPKVLRKRIAELERQKAPVEADHSECERRITQLETELQITNRACVRMVDAFEKVIEHATEVRDGVIVDMDRKVSMPRTPAVPTIGVHPISTKASRELEKKVFDRVSPNYKITKPVNQSNGNGDLTGPQRKLVNVLALCNGRCSRKKLALQAGYSHNGGAFNNPLGKLRSSGYIDYQSGDVVLLVDPASIGVDVQPMPTGPELIDWWLNEGGLTGPERDIVEALRNHGKPMTKEALARAVNKSADGGAFNNPIGRLRTRGIIERGQPIRFSDEVLS